MVFKTPFESPQMRRVKNIFFIGIGGAGTVSYTHLTLPTILRV